MSSTKRNGHKPRKDGNYATPLWAVRALLPYLPKAERILDPCAGKGNILRVLGEAYADQKLKFLGGIELDAQRAEQCASLPGVKACLCANALNPNVHWNSPNLIVTNPPFSVAEIFCRLALSNVATNGTVAILLRMSFAAGIHRKLFWSRYQADMLVLTRRPSFDKVGDSDTDSCDYAWFIFGPQATGKWLRLEVLEPSKKSKTGE